MATVVGDRWIIRDIRQGAFVSAGKRVGEAERQKDALKRTRAWTENEGTFPLLKAFFWGKTAHLVPEK